mmetsp:Transcript_333/g.509  ORF Transcript_333/g.509 Transcript_333/m.509 type:complete len:163 (-) Transcript_333:1111-1599(-)
MSTSMNTFHAMRCDESARSKESHAHGVALNITCSESEGIEAAKVSSRGDGDRLSPASWPPTAQTAEEIGGFFSLPLVSVKATPRRKERVHHACHAQNVGVTASYIASYEVYATPPCDARSTCAMRVRYDTYTYRHYTTPQKEATILLLLRSIHELRTWCTYG